MNHRALIGVAVLVVAIAGCSRTGQPADPGPGRPTDTALPSIDRLATEVGSSLALVETPLATGSGVLLPGPVLVTTAHVVWPYRAADVRFPDGTRSTGLDVIAVDWVADLALIDLSTVDPGPLPLLTGAPPPAVGEPVFLVGYPAGSVDDPVIVSGKLTASRVWAEAGLEYLETDAVVQGGHSGGALVDAQGRLLGITGLELGDRGALALAFSDLAERVSAMSEHRDIEGIGGRWTDDLDAAPGPSPKPRNPLDEVTWVFDTTVGVDVVLEASPAGLLSGSVIGPDGYLEATLDGSEMRFTPTVSGPHFATLVPGTAVGSVIELTGDPGLTRLIDPDHGRVIDRGSLVFGNVDRPGDLDWFTIDLAAGETIDVTASSPNADTALFVGPADALDGPDVGGSSDGAGGVLGSDAHLSYTAPRAGTYVVAVYDETQFGPGAYALAVMP